MTTKIGIFLAWGGMSFIDTWPNINSVCDLPAFFLGQFMVLGGFCQCSLLFFLGGGCTKHSSLMRPVAQPLIQAFGGSTC